MPAEKPLIESRESGVDLVFSTIRQTAPVPRIDIARVTGLSPATVTSITADLLAHGLIEEIATDPAAGALKRGRPRVDLKVRGDAHIVAGIKLSEKEASVVFLDFDGKRISDFKNPLPAPLATPQRAVEFLADSLSLSLADAALEINDISGVGVGIPGTIDAVAGHVYWSPVIGGRDIALQRMLSERLEVPVFIDNDANLVTLAEQRFGLGKKSRNFIVVTVDQGVGMGIIIDGHLYRGAHGCGAELGHTKVHLDGALCRCGQRGCLEAYVGDYALLREASTATGLAPEQGQSTEGQMRALLAEANSGNALAQSILQRAGRMFAMGLANVVNVFSPELIILSGERLDYDYLYKDAVIEEMKKSIVQFGGPLPEVRVHNWRDQMWTMGAASFAIDGVTKIALERIG